MLDSALRSTEVQLWLLGINLCSHTSWTPVCCQNYLRGRSEDTEWRRSEWLKRGLTKRGKALIFTPCLNTNRGNVIANGFHDTHHFLEPNGCVLQRTKHWALGSNLTVATKVLDDVKLWLFSPTSPKSVKWQCTNNELLPLLWMQAQIPQNKHHSA